jgi:hypothetical protein
MEDDAPHFLLHFFLLSPTFFLLHLTDLYLLAPLHAKPTTMFTSLSSIDWIAPCASMLEQAWRQIYLHHQELIRLCNNEHVWNAGSAASRTVK